MRPNQVLSAWWPRAIIPLERNEGTKRMKRALLTGCLGLLALLLTAGPAAGPAHAIKPFADEFTAKYVKKEGKERKDQDFARLVEEAKCFVCHVGKSKKDRNPYGVELAKLLDNKTDKANKDKIHSALAKVEKLPSNPQDKNSPTFGQLIQQGKLPGGAPAAEKAEVPN